MVNRFENTKRAGYMVWATVPTGSILFQLWIKKTHPDFRFICSKTTNIVKQKGKIHRTTSCWSIDACTVPWSFKQGTASIVGPNASLNGSIIGLTAKANQHLWKNSKYPLKIFRRRKTRLYLAEAVYTITLISDIRLYPSFVWFLENCSSYTHLYFLAKILFAFLRWRIAWYGRLSSK